MTKKIKSTPRIRKDIPIVYEDYRDMLTMEMRCCTDLYLQNLAADMVKWVDESPDNLCLGDFFHSRGIAIKNLYSWLPKSEELRDAHEFVMTRLGSKRERGAIKKEYDSAMIRTTMPHYDKIWKEMEEWRSKLKEAGESGDKVVVIERFPDVPSVPERKKDEY